MAYQKRSSSRGRGYSGSSRKRSSASKSRRSTTKRSRSSGGRSREIRIVIQHAPDPGANSTIVNPMAVASSNKRSRF